MIVHDHTIPRHIFDRRSMMFYYISFLRPPPSSSAPGSISFTPQVANDLRTELFTETQDIYYVWLLSAESTEATQVKPRKLTTWSQAVAYKEISVALPPSARPGQSWRLLLSASPSIQDTTIPLGNVRSTGKIPFPVISMPIKITPKPEKNPAKQTQIERVYRVPLAGHDDLHYLLREQTSFDLDKVIDFYFTFGGARVLTILESLGQWDRVEFVVGESVERHTIRNWTTRDYSSEGCAFVKPL